MERNRILLLVCFLGLFVSAQAQNVPILDYSVNSYGQVELEIEGEADKYYLLTAQHEPELDYESITSITMGQDGLMTISEPLEAFSILNYKITAHSIADPDDTDGDNSDDITEFNDMPYQAPLNYAAPVPAIDGTTSVDNRETFEELAVVSPNIPWAQFLNDQEFAKFAIVNQDSDFPEVYFINSNTHQIHNAFLATLGLNLYVDDVTTGEIVYNPNEILPTGVIGTYSFNYSFGNSYSFDHTRRTFELLAANMPFLQNNFKHFIGAGGENAHINIYKDDFDGGRITVDLESDVFADVDFLPFHPAEGYGYFRHMQLDENPGSRDIVLYDALPNSLPRVGGIITSVVQTPLSHVNLRAIQDNVPNAYIREPLEVDSIASLIGKYIYYKVESDRYEIREATLEEVNDWYENIRPTESQIPDRDLSFTEILPLDEIEFSMSTAFGAKCSNVATMRTFSFPDGTIPDGFGIPFYYYDEFMKYNGFYEEATEMMADTDFVTDLEVRIETLKEFRRDIKDADMPQWMLDDLEDMHRSFPEGTAVRCRSSTNNEDLPGFSGAGLYTSKTQHLDEGHISKSIKQVYASMWNFRAFEERDFYRVVHDVAAMGVLCHPNFQEEKSNGVGVSLDPIYSTENTFYLNTQVGENLITNPEENAVPEEILLNEDPAEGYLVLRNSNLVMPGELVMSEDYLNLMRDYLREIHDEFAILYNVVGAEGFGMDIEYKVTAEDQLIIKQARPWVSFWAEINANYDLAVLEIVDPESSSTLTDTELVTIKVANQGLRTMKDFELLLSVDDVPIETLLVTEELNPLSESDYQFTVPIDFSVLGKYDLSVIVSHPSDTHEENDTLNTEIHKLHLLEGSIDSELKEVKCGDVIELFARVANLGEETLVKTEIEIVSNGMVIDTLVYDFGIPTFEEVELILEVSDNLQAVDNVITLNLIELNDQTDAVSTNNSDSFNTDLDTDFVSVTLVINADNYPQETTYALYDNTNGIIVADGGLSSGTDLFSEEFCVLDNACFTLYVFDSYSDGICCSFGQGNFSVLNALGETIVFNDGDFGAVAEESFCLGDAVECDLTADIEVTDASTGSSSDGSILINASGGTPSYEYSIDNGQSFDSNNLFTNLPVDTYEVVVRDATENCIYQEVVEVTFISSVNDLDISVIKVFPNPTNGNFIIKIEDGFNVSEDLRIEVFNSLGELMQSRSIGAGGTSALINLENYPSGTYVTKCSNQHFEKYFKVIKI